MPERTRFVDPDVSGGLGDGTSIANAYTSQAAFEAAEQTDLVSAGDWMHCYCLSSLGTADTTEFIFDGWITNKTTNYILMEAYTGNEVLKSGWDATRYRLEADSTFRLIRVRRSIDVRFKGIQIRNTGAGHAIEVSGDGGSPSLLVENCRIEKPNGGSGITSISGTMDTKNSIVEGSNTGSGNGVYWTSTSGGGSSYNTISRGFTDGFESDGVATTICKNCVSFDNTSDDFDAITTVDHCLSDTGVGTNPQIPSGGLWLNEFVDLANGDFTAVQIGRAHV